MNKWRRFLGLRFADQRLIVQCAIILAMIRIGLVVFHFRTLRRILSRVSRGATTAAPGKRQPVRRIVWAVSAVGRNLPYLGNCLAQALGAQLLLRRHGHASVLRIGVDREDKRGFNAHAWLEVEGRIVIGGSERLSRFVPLPPLKQEL